MVKTVKLDNVRNYLMDSSTGEKIMKYDPSNQNLLLSIQVDDSILQIEASNITQEFGGEIVVFYNGDKYIIDDGFQNVLLKSGYIVFKDFDQIKEFDPEIGNQIRSNIFYDIMETIPEALEVIHSELRYAFIDSNDSMISFKVEQEDLPYDYTFKIDTINSIVSKNLIRKGNSLAFYPFDKNMDKFGTVYLSVFAQRKLKFGYEDPNAKPEKYVIADIVIRELIKKLGSNYHYIAQIIKRRVIDWNGI